MDKHLDNLLQRIEVEATPIVVGWNITREQNVMTEYSYRKFRVGLNTFINSLY
jgi:hypothetical protein